MSEFDKFCSAAKKTAGTIATKAGEMVDHAATKLKIKGLQLRMDEQYETLGKLVYRALRTGENTEEERNKAVAEIDALNEKIAALKEKCAAGGSTGATETETTETDVGSEESATPDAGEAVKSDGEEPLGEKATEV